MNIHYHILTIGEPETHRLIAHVATHRLAGDTLTVWHNRINPEELLAISLSVSPYPDVLLVRTNGVGDAERYNEMLESTPQGEWAVMLDADEWVMNEFFTAIHAELDRAQADGNNVVSLPRVNVVYEQKSIPPCRFPAQEKWGDHQAYPDYGNRVVRCDAGVYFVRHTHYTVDGSVRRHFTSLPELHLLHHKRVESYSAFVSRKISEIARDEFRLWDEGIGREVYAGNCYRMFGKELVGQVVVDVGAHIGYASILALDLGARLVVSCESCPDNFAALKKNLGRYPDACHRAIHAAVWRSDDTKTSVSMSLFPHDANANTGGYGVTTAPNSNTVDVTAIALDSILGEFEEVALLKMDCEGSEFPILYTSKLLGRCRNIALEYHEGSPLAVEGRFNNRIGLANLLRSQGFTVDLPDNPNHIGMMYATRQ